MLSQIEEFILGGNVAHDLISLNKSGDFWLITVSPTYDRNVKKSFKFQNVQEKYEQDLTDEGEGLEYPLPIVGFDSKPLSNGLWDYCLNTADIEWGFVSNWPENA